MSAESRDLLVLHYLTDPIKLSCQNAVLPRPAVLTHLRNFTGRRGWRVMSRLLPIYQAPRITLLKKYFCYWSHGSDYLMKCTFFSFWKSVKISVQYLIPFLQMIILKEWCHFFRIPSNRVFRGVRKHASKKNG